MSATPDSTLTHSAQLVADLQRELAVSYAERDAALAREVATADVLQVINSSSGDLAPVFGAMLERQLSCATASKACCGRSMASA